MRQQWSNEQIQITDHNEPCPKKAATPHTHRNTHTITQPHTHWCNTNPITSQTSLYVCSDDSVTLLSSLLFSRHVKRDFSFLSPFSLFFHTLISWSLSSFARIPTVSTSNFNLNSLSFRIHIRRGSVSLVFACHPLDDQLAFLPSNFYRFSMLTSETTTPAKQTLFIELD